MSKSSANRGKQPGNLPEAATDSTAKPGNYPVGSLESRAAARALVDSEKEEEMVIQIVFGSPDRTTENGPVYRIPAISHRQ
jgi:hypothetical protein